MNYRIIGSSILLSLLMAVTPELMANNKFSALVIRVKGQATLTRSGKSSKLKKNMLVMENDLITTNAASYVGLQFSNGVSSNVGPKSKININKLVNGADGRQIHMNVAKGSLTSRVKKDTSKVDMHVSGPTLVAAVRGTEFSVEADQSDETTVAVNEGEVAVSSETDKVKEQTVKAGNKIIADAKGARTAILDAHDKAKFRMLQQLESLKKAQFEAYTDQVRRNEALRENMRKSILNPE